LGADLRSLEELGSNTPVSENSLWVLAAQEAERSI
jgi:hypothetical protein